MDIGQRLRKQRRRWVRKLGKKMLRGLFGFLGRQSLVGNPVVFDAAQFPWTAELEAHWRDIRAEVEPLLTFRDRLPNFQDISPDQYKISTDDKWKTYIFYGFGYRSERNCARCPKTAQLLAKIPNLQTAFFSILAPGMHIKAHRGVTKGLLRCHLGLIVPEPRDKCVMRVGDHLCQWEEGKSLVFDDTAQHEVWNETAGERVVLLLDFHRPLRFPGTLVSRALLSGLRMSAYVREARRNEIAWEDRFEREFIN